MEADRAGLPDRKSGSLQDGGFSATGAYEDMLCAVEFFDGTDS